MKRVIFVILALIGIWQLLRLPSINAALFAFMTLGINPLTNHQVSTPFLISILLAAGLGSMIIFFSRAISDFFGGLSDWLTRADRTADALNGATVSSPIALAVLPAQSTSDAVVETNEPLAAASVSTSTPAIAMPAFELPNLDRYLARLHKRYTSVVIAARTRLVAVKRKPNENQKSVAVDPLEVHNKDIHPDLVEVLAIFIQMTKDAESAGSEEAIIATQNRLWAVTRRQITKAHIMVAVKRTAMARDAAQVSVQAHMFGLTARKQTRFVARMTSGYIKRIALRLYRAALLVVLGMLISGSALLQVASSGLRLVAHGGVVLYRRSCQATAFTAGGIRFGILAVGRGIVIGVSATTHGFASLFRATYRLFATLVVAALLGAGYTLYGFSLICFIAWELAEPYVRVFDKWLGDSFNSKDGLVEMSKVGREMSRTFAQWYREIRRIKSSLYR